MNRWSTPGEAHAYETGYVEGRAEAQTWIPCSERLPDKYDEYLITFTNSYYGKKRFVNFSEYEPSLEYDYENNRFKGEWLLKGFAHKDRINVIAWRESPDTYKG